MTARDELLYYCLAATPNEVTVAKSEQLADAYRAEVLREAAEIGRELSRQGYSAQEIANQLDRRSAELTGGEPS
ncbi:hypothetical protein [Streptomyces formicae]